MLLAHQAGAVRVGEVVRYKLTYTPSSDRILPTPNHLHIRIRNTTAIALRAAYLHGPYTLHVSACPSSFNPYEKYEDVARCGEPEFEPYLKAGGHWQTKLTIPEDIRERGDAPTSDKGSDSVKSVTWIIEVASQILFSSTASVDFEFLVARDARSLDVGFAAVAGKGYGEPGRVEDFVERRSHTNSGQSTHPKGVYSKAIQLEVNDTASLWSKPELPQWNENTPHEPGLSDNLERDDSGAGDGSRTSDTDQSARRKQKKLHLVIVTHGLHSNLGADMLFLKESIDAASEQARKNARKRRRAKASAATKSYRKETSEDAPSSSKQSNEEDGASASEIEARHDDSDDEANDEQVIVRGFPGNAVKTEKGIQYLGKRLAKYILTITYPDQPYLPPSKSTARTFTNSFAAKSSKSGQESAHHASKADKQLKQLPYTFTKISFVGHSLGGLTQTYAMAWIQKHSPSFFKKIKPENFITLASPLLGLSNENPLYVKFALDFGLVGRTGRDLGLSWRAPTFTRSGWSAIIGGFGGSSNPNEGESKTDPTSKPLLRILPTGPAHQVLKLFRNRTVYSNVVNDGIVPLRTSCLLFLDWRGLDRVENAQRDNGLIATMASFGWNELTGANTQSHRPKSGKSGYETSPYESNEDLISSTTTSRKGAQIASPTNISAENDSIDPLEPAPHQFLAQQHADTGSSSGGIGGTTVYSDDGNAATSGTKSATSVSNPFNDFFNFFRPNSPRAQTGLQKDRKVSKKTSEKFNKAQTIMIGDSDSSQSGTGSSQQADPKDYLRRPTATRGDSLNNDPNRIPPPKTTVFEAAGDILNPPIPTREWILDPSRRQRTIFHDRVYHPEDIPPASPKRPRLGRSFSSGSLRSNSSTTAKEPAVQTSGIRVEEKIARAYHRELSWRKVLVRLEPDAHNNMIVRRMFANAYGWEVVKHLCDTHFSDSYAATTKDDEELLGDRAKSAEKPVGKAGEEVHGQLDHEAPRRGPVRTTSELQEATDDVRELELPQHALRNMSSSSKMNARRFSKDNDSTDSWNEDVFEGSDGEASDEEAAGPLEMFQRFWNAAPKEKRRHSDQHSHHHSPNESRNKFWSQGEQQEKQGTSEAEIADFLTQSPIAEKPERTKRRSERQRMQNIDPHTVAMPHDGVEQESSQEPRDASGSGGIGLSELGLQKPLVEQVSGPGSSPEPNSPRTPSSLTEQVARLSTEGKGSGNGASR